MVQTGAPRKGTVSDHIELATAWLDGCDADSNTPAISYSALEFRLAIERLAVRIWAQLLGRKPNEADLNVIRSFKGLENKIYDLAGHQLAINRHFEFMRILLDALEIDINLITPDMGQLAKHWSTCSELCHVGGTLACHHPQYRAQALSDLRAVKESLLKQSLDTTGWPAIGEGEISELRSQFIAGEATKNDILAFLKKVGVWSKVDYKDGRPSHFMGKAIPPNECDPTK